MIFFVLIKKNSVHASNDVEIINEELEIVEIPEEKEEVKEEIVEIQKVKVDIKGEVSKPGVYELELGKRIIDVVNLSGGFTKKAITRNINLSKKIYDEMVIIIPDDSITCEVIPSYIIEEPNTKIEETKDGLINLNTASFDELMNLTGIGETKARQIIEYRGTNGFNKIEDIMNIPGIKESLFEKIKDEITV